MVQHCWVLNRLQSAVCSTHAFQFLPFLSGHFWLLKRRQSSMVPSRSSSKNNHNKARARAKYIERHKRAGKEKRAVAREQEAKRAKPSTKQKPNQTVQKIRHVKFATTTAKPFTWAIVVSKRRLQLQIRTHTHTNNTFKCYNCMCMHIQRKLLQQDKRTKVTKRGREERKRERGTKSKTMQICFCSFFHFNSQNSKTLSEHQRAISPPQNKECVRPSN